jgi:protein tyrosine phosphatase (PTP) superfamily phosphohydrolase (DUF442 family)
MRCWIFRWAQSIWAVARSRRWQYRVLAATATALLFLVAAHVWYVSLGPNFHTVVAGDVYRSGQPTASDLRQLARSYGVRTVINLRGETQDEWYYEEHEVGRDLGVRVVDVGLWARQSPEVEQFRLLVNTLADARGAVLVHCNSGGDRSGLAAALALLLRTDASVTTAREQLSVYYGHNPFGKAACQDRVLDCYEAWRAQRGWQHTRVRLRLGADTVYERQKKTPASSWQGSFSW